MRNLFKAVLLVLLTCGVAKADTYSFSFSVSGISNEGKQETYKGSGQFTTTADLITSVTGKVNGATITGIVPVGTFPTIASGNPANDNLFFDPAVDGGEFDINGVSFAADGVDYNLYYFDPGYGLATGPTGDETYLYMTLDPTKVSSDYLIIAPAATPEPASLFLLGTSLILGFKLRSKA